MKNCKGQKKDPEGVLLTLESSRSLLQDTLELANG